MAKIYRFIFSALLICASFAGKGQTVDGKLYTIFNNWYQWSGGKFNTNLNIPKVTATTGRDTGGIRYALADSSVYIWTGSQWRKVGQGTDTTSLSNRIDLRVKYTDTAAMLSPYLRSNVAAATYQPIGNYDTATVVKAYVTNAEAVTITKGQVVYIFGASGDRASVKLAKNTSDTFSSKTLGIVRADIAAGQAGWITTQGQVSGINLSAYSPGDILWLDSVAGGFTKNKPQAPYHSVFVGVVERANAGNGLIYVKPQNGQELGELHDTKITSPTNNQVLAYTAATDIWENKSVTTALGYTPLNGGANLSGTGVAIFKDTSSNKLNFKRLKAGTGITVTDNTDSVTVATDSAAWQSVSKSYYEVSDFLGGLFNSNQQIQNTTFYPANISGASHSVGTDADAFGSVQLSTLTSSSASPGIGSGGNNTILNTETLIFTARVKIPTLSDGTQSYHIQIGYADGYTTNLTNAMMFTYDSQGTQTGSSTSPNWQTSTQSGGVRTFNQNHTGVAVGTGWTVLRIEATSSSVVFKVGGVTVATHTTNIPSTYMGSFVALRKTAGVTARTILLDYITIDRTFGTQH
jgi:hypothetical protein